MAFGVLLINHLHFQDGSDEEDCEGQNACNADTEYQCDNGYCINMDWVKKDEEKISSNF